MQTPESATHSSVPPVSAPAPIEAELTARRGGFPWGWLLLAAVIGALVFVKVKFFPAPAANVKGGGKGAPGAGGPGGKGGPAPKTPVKVYVVAPTRLTDEVAATGSVLADEAVTIKAEIPGKITSLNIREGQPVRKGQVLFTINAVDIQARLQKQAYNLKLYQDQEARQRVLLQKEFISAQEYEQVNNQLLTARADQQALQADLEKAYVRAPFDGVLGLTTATVGTYVSPGAAITTLARIRPVKIAFTVPGRFAATVRPGDTVRVTDEGTNKEYAAVVYALDPQLDPVSRSLPVRARYANRHDELRPGAYVKVNLELGTVAQAIQVPTESVVPVASGYQVYKVVGGKVQPQDVQIGIRSEQVIQITKGLAVGDTLLRTGVLQVKPGDAVLISK